MGTDAAAVGYEARRRRDAGQRVAGFVGGDPEVGAAMAEEMLGGVDETVEVAELPPPATC
jgi:hypothetical protein